MRKQLLLFLLLCMQSIARGQTGYTYRYWFDNNDSNIEFGNSSTGKWKLNANTENLSGGIHSFHLQVVDGEGKLSSPITKYFVKSFGGEQSMQGEYWFDNDQTAKHLSPQSVGSFYLDVSGLSDGFHTVNYQVKDENGESSPIASGAFIKIPQTEGVDYLTCLCNVDGQLYKEEKVSSSGGAINWNLDVSELNQGLHYMQIQVVTPSGAATGFYDSYFLRTTKTLEMSDMKCFYSIDGDEFVHEAGQMNDGIYHCDLDVSQLTDGLHRITYLLANGKGVQTKLQTQFFVKTPIGGEGLMSYEYWVNENSNSRKIVTMSNHVDSFRLVSLLPIESQPIRSKMFHFTVEKGQPVLYAKNDIHFRFFDTAERFAEVSKQYVDYQKKQIVNNLVSININETKTIEVPKANEIRWFSFTSEPGDTVSFKTSQATSIQVFDPNGEEVYSASGSNSVEYGGCHTWVNGTYYVAIHDVTGSKPDISLDFSHLAKYDVVRQDVRVVGNDGCSTITFDGNGFKDLYAVELKDSQGNSVHSKTIGFQNDACTSVTFDFTGCKIGQYDAVFHFTASNKEFKNILTVEEAKNIELSLDVKYPSTYLQGATTTYSITVTNKGNATAYDVPMEIYLRADDVFSNIQYVRFKDENGLDVNSLKIGELEKDSIDDETLAYIDDLLQRLNGLQSFIVKKDSVDGGEYGFTDMLLTIPANSSVSFYVDIKCSTTVQLNVRIPSEWLTIHASGESDSVKSPRRRAPENNLCCQKERWECGIRLVADVVNTITSFSADPILSSLGCIADIVDLGTYTAFEIICADGNNSGDKLKSFWNNTNKRNSAFSKLVNTTLGCVTLGIGKILTKLNKSLKPVKKSFDDAWNSLNKYKKLSAEAHQKYDVAYRNFDRAVMSGDMDLAGVYKKEYENAEQLATLYDEWVVKWQKQVTELNGQYVSIKSQNESLKDILEKIFKFLQDGLSSDSDMDCDNVWHRNEPNCPPKPKEGGGPSAPVNSYDPNDIYGYVAESGSKAVKKDLTSLYYTIEFENDPEFATAAAHEIVVTNTLDANKFDLSTFTPTQVKIGDRSVELNGDKNFVATIDMRPQINAIAQVEGTFDEATGMARWHISSLDPMTMEPTDEPMDGILPVNANGNGIGELLYTISRKSNLAHATEVTNQASIVFDKNDAILTPVWTNVIDAIAPVSKIVSVEQTAEDAATVRVEVTDELSGAWRYDVYVQQGIGSAWFKAAENVPIGTDAEVKIYENINHGFYVVATDMAGNIEQKEPAREFTLNLTGVVDGDANGDGKVDIADVTAVTNHINGLTPSRFQPEAANVNKDGLINIADVTGIINIINK